MLRDGRPREASVWWSWARSSPSSDGVCDECADKGIPAFGPSALAAEIEASKAWSKAFMNRHGLKTAAFETFRREEGDKARDYVKSCGHSVVVKASGLAAGKGVLVPPPNDIEAALKAVDEMFHPTNKAFGAAGDVVVIEQLLTGPEISLFAFCDGTTARGACSRPRIIKEPTMGIEGQIPAAWARTRRRRKSRQRNSRSRSASCKKRSLV